MELRQLEYLVAVADEASFTRAAARLHVAQPGVSAQIRRLEREFGEELLDRTGRVIRPTAAGATVLPHARAALKAVDDARVAVDELTGLVRGRVAMGVLTACGALDLAGLLATFHSDHPGVAISLSEDNSDRLLTALRRGRLDVAVIGSAGPPQPDVCTETLIDEPLVAAVGPDDPLVGQDRIALADLCERDLISMPVGTGLRACLDQACAEAGLSPRIALQAGDPNVLARLAGRGLGVAILAESMAGPAGLHAVTVVPGLRSRVELAWRADGPTSPAARALIAHARVLLTSR
jgi:DNA-binding transcriptional LysR family regulator